MIFLIFVCVVIELDIVIFYLTDPRGQCLAYTGTACYCAANTSPDGTYWACDPEQVDAFCDAAWEAMDAPMGQCEVDLVRASCDPTATDPDAAWISWFGAMAACEGEV